MMYLLGRDQLLRGMTAIETAEPSLWRNGVLKEDRLGTLVGTMIRAKVETIEARERAEMVEMTSRPGWTPPERTTGQLEGSSIHKKGMTGEEAMQGLDHLGMINNPRESMVEVKRLHHMAEDLDQAWAVEVVLELPVKASDLDVDHDPVEDGPERLRWDEMWMTSTGRQGWGSCTMPTEGLFREIKFRQIVLLHSNDQQMISEQIEGI